jgi:signal transduction histidine kinase
MASGALAASVYGTDRRKWLRRYTEKAESLLARLIEVAKDAHVDVRESILSLKAGSAQEWSFFNTLKQYLDSYQAYYGVHSEISLPEGIEEIKFDPSAGVQILRVIQEALTNARKYSGAHNVKVVFQTTGNGHSLPSLMMVRF